MDILKILIRILKIFKRSNQVQTGGRKVVVKKLENCFKMTMDKSAQKNSKDHLNNYINRLFQMKSKHKQHLHTFNYNYHQFLNKLIKTQHYQSFQFSHHSLQ